MKRFLVIVALGLSLCLSACSKDSTNNSNSTDSEIVELSQESVNNLEDDSTEVTTTDSTQSDTQEDDLSNNEAYIGFANIMDDIYDIQAGSAGATLRAENVVYELNSYMKDYGMDSASAVYETFANYWFDDMIRQYGQDVRMDFSDCLDTFEDVAYEKDSELETDVYFSNIISGMRMAIGS